MPGWTQDEVATLTRMRDEGRTAAEISAVMPHHSRSAVLGRINRMGLSDKLPALSIADRKTRRRERQSMAERNRAAQRREKTALPRLIRGKVVHGLAPDGALERVPQPINQPCKENRVRFLDSGIDHCKFIVDSDEPIMSRMVCGEPLFPGDDAYCAFHHGICWQPAPRRVPVADQKPINHITSDPRRRRAVA